MDTTTYIPVLIIIFSISLAFALETCLRNAVNWIDCLYRKRKFLSVLRKGVISSKITHFDIRHIAALWGLDEGEVLSSLRTLAHESVAQHQRFGQAGKDCALALLAAHKEGLA